MNRFLISYTPEWIARELCDKHIVKMPLEEAQMLSTAVWQHAPEYAEKHDLYKPVHQSIHVQYGQLKLVPTSTMALPCLTTCKLSTATGMADAMLPISITLPCKMQHSTYPKVI